MERDFQYIIEFLSVEGVNSEAGVGMYVRKVLSSVPLCVVESSEYVSRVSTSWFSSGFESVSMVLNGFKIKGFLCGAWEVGELE